ncbi:ER lumen protein retaining receptor [Beauveria bassiana D1-5]|uniref:ER lumen protein-retaining receptor n=1 Tax=Beauveria bassiana D1-5 TaxID=1245745 RepID=A0A0A2WAU5_BEABA|nr:ER lumen protein retaining receptor [Beauveria bassiana D1-5]
MTLNIFRLAGALHHPTPALHPLLHSNMICSRLFASGQHLYLAAQNGAVKSIDAHVRLIDLFSTNSLYNFVFKILFIGSQGYIIYLMTNAYKPTNDPNVDTFRVQYLLGAAAVLAVVFPVRYTVMEILWAFSIWLESVAILPQLFMLQRTGEAETITTHYLFALGSYRALYIPNWIYRYLAEPNHKPDWIAIAAGLIQTVLYSDFFYIYYTKVLKGKKFKLPV